MKMRTGDLHLLAMGTLALLLAFSGCDAQSDVPREVIELSRVQDETCKECRQVTIDTIEHSKIKVRVPASPDLVVERKDIERIELRETLLMNEKAVQVSAAITPAAGARVREWLEGAGDDSRVLVSFAGGVSNLANLAEGRHLGSYLPLGFHSPDAVAVSSELFQVAPPGSPIDSSQALRDRYESAVRESQALIEGKE